MSINDKKTVKRYIVKRDLKGLFPKEFTGRDLIGKYFDYVMNNFFQTSYERYINGYIGKKTNTLEEGNYYVSETTPERQLYQLTPMLVDTNSENNIKDIVDYTNFINDLKLQGALTNDHNRLLSNEHWSYCPPIDVDMFLNYNFYYWIEEGVKPIILESGTNAVIDIIGQKNYTYQYVDESLETKNIPFYNGMRIIFRNDANLEYNNKTFIVEGVNKSIILVDDSEIYNPNNNEEPEYFVMERGCNDGNPWSLRNRWFHIDDIKMANFYNQIDDDKIKYIQAKKPILCFNRNIELYNFGNYDRGWVDVSTTELKNNINGLLINKNGQNGKLFIEGKYLDSGAKILFTNEPISENNNMIYELFLIDNGENNLVTLYPVVNGQDINGKPVKGECIKIKNRLNYCYHYDGENWVVSQQKLKVCQSPLFNLYDKNGVILNDKEIYPNSSFEGNTLFNYKTVTNKSASIDEDLKRRYASDGYGNYIFMNTIESEKYTYKEVGKKDKKVIEGIRFYKKEDKFLNDWHLSKDVLTQYVITEINVTEPISEYTLIDEKGLPIYYNTFKLAYQPCENLYKKNAFVYVNGQLLTDELYFIDEKVLYISKQINLKAYDNIFVKLLIENDDEVINIVVSEINDSKSFILKYNYSGELTKQNVFVYINDILIDNNKYYIKNNVLYFDESVELNINDVINVKIITNNDRELVEGYVYDLPLMLTSNGKNENIEEIKYNEMFPQLESILENQIGFEGVINGANNYKDTLKDVSLGTKILQHSTPILKTMLLNSKQYTDVRNVLTYISTEYTKFKNKFNLIINNMVNSGQYTEYNLETYTKTNPFDIVIKALNKINIGKEGLKPFYNNGVAEQIINLDDEDNNYLVQPYIPATPAYLGLDNCYKPEIIKSNDLDLKQNVLLCHDGSYSPISNDYRDEALLELETQIYDSISEDFKNGLPVIIKQKIIPGKFRKTDYSYEDYLKIYTPFFEKWCIENNLDYSINDTFNEYNSFTWNWSSCYDKDGFKLPGSYRAIYMYYYDTDKPHTHPWEMLGFGNKPEWWEEHYGTAPYTSANIPMWKDIEEGHIIDGISEGYYEEFKREGLVENYLPVDSEGNLLPPYEAGIATTKPIMKYAREPWKIGDLGHIENIFKYTSEYKYDIQAILYLMKPLMWVERSWDSLKTDILFPGTDYEQIINLNSGKRDTQDDIIMHNEYINGEYIKRIGSQQWFSDFLTNETIDITDYIANDLRNVDLRLGYRCAGFFDKDSMRLLSDNYGIIPSNNYHLKLSERITGNVYNYSGIIITKKGNYWTIDGYDNEYPYFNILTPNKNGKKSSVEINGRNFTYYHEYGSEFTPIKYKTIYTSAQELYNTIIGYGKYLESIGFVFNIIDANGEVIDFRYCGKEFLLWYSNNDNNNNSFIILNPMREELNLKHFGFADVIGKFFNGQWCVKDQLSNPIYNKDLKVYRHNGYVTVKPRTNYLANVKLTTTEKENIMVIDNETIYGDILFNSLKGIKTDRFKLLGIKTNGWNGTYFAPGYIINQEETIEPNYDKLANDFNYIYDSDDIRSISKMGEEAKKTIGYHKTNYMENLVIDDRNMFDFYKGMIKEKGTRLAFNKLNRSTRIMSEGSSKLNLDEHWAFNIGQFGYTNDKSVIELYINADDINHDPQIITFSSDPDYTSTDDSNIAINWNDKRWLKRNENQDKNTFMYKKSDKKLPIGGFAQLDDVKYILDTKSNLMDNVDNIEVGEKTWVVKDNTYTWNVYKKIDDMDNPFKSLKVKNIKGLLSYDCHNLEKDDLIYVEHDILNNWIARLTDDEQDNETNIYFNDPKGLTHNDNYNIKTNGWSVFKYNGLIPYSNIISMDNGIITILNNDTYYSVRIEKDLMVDMPDGLDDEGKNKYYEYRSERYLNVKLEDLDRYLFIDNIGNYYTSSERISFEEPSNPIKNQFWYNKEENIFNRYNGYYWDNSKINLYAWSNDTSTIYTISDNPNDFDNVYTIDENIDATKYGNISQTPKIKKFAWIKDGELYYTDNEYPIAGDKVYSNPTTTTYTYIVSSYFEGNDFFYVDDIKFDRSEEDDVEANINVTDGSIYYRDKDEDKSSKHYAFIAEVKVNNNSLVDINVSNPFTLERVEPKPINYDIFKTMYLIDNESDRTLGKMNLYDPLHCILPDFVMNEIDYILSYDPVNYDDANRWYDDKLGRLWWDTSKVRYLDYYQGDLKYRRDNWGKQLPGSEIAIMEWTKSTILPEDVGNYLTREVYNPETDKNDIFYYFWVLNPTITPDYDFRTTSAYDISRKINSPQDEGILWFAPIQLNNRIYDDSSFIIGNFDDVTTSQDFVVQINFKNKNDIDDHNEWLMIVPESDDNIPDLLWNKMKDSLITEDTMGNVVPDSSLTEIEKYGILLRPRQSMFKNIIKARRNFIDICNEVFTSRDVRYFSSIEGSGLLIKDESYNNYKISYEFENHEEMINTPDKSLIGNYVLVKNDEDYDGIWTLWLMEGINDYSLVDYQKYDMNRYIYYIDAFLNNNYTKDTYNIKVYNNKADKKMAELIEKGIPDGYIVRIDDYTTREWLYLKQYNSETGTFYTVGIKDGYIQIDNKLYSYMEDSLLLKNYNNKLDGDEYNEFINGLTEYEYIDQEVKKLIGIICNYFYND